MGFILDIFSLVKWVLVSIFTILKYGLLKLARSIKKIYSAYNLHTNKKKDFEAFETRIKNREIEIY